MNRTGGPRQRTMYLPEGKKRKAACFPGEKEPVFAEKRTTAWATGNWALTKASRRPRGKGTWPGSREKKEGRSDPRPTSPATPRSGARKRDRLDGKKKGKRALHRKAKEKGRMKRGRQGRPQGFLVRSAGEKRSPSSKKKKKNERGIERERRNVSKQKPEYIKRNLGKAVLGFEDPP